MLVNPRQRFYYCPKCGHELKYVNHQERPRLTCSSCSFIFYENPIVGVAAIVLNENRQILLGRRKGGQFSGLWCIPCGYLEYGEDVYVGIRREFKEETNLDIELQSLFTVQSNYHDPECYTVGIWFIAKIIGGKIKAGDDLDKLAFFDLENSPSLAFPTDKKVITYLNTKKKSDGIIIS